ncbi:hypothetical protein OE88DRAFT_1651796 [Heliocybe sulcata]|uniref:Uncharacterized protein n=1 Tax=Heliocybe sulcata TaxID=5364 RepID=A0A5C3NDR9_9AGAM|nr:hypothetical protein OE88DRAFT_1651796 [Heliocybe sulcata]
MPEPLSFADVCLGPYERARAMVGKLPDLKRDTVPLDECCPICLLNFGSFYEEQAIAVTEAKEADIEEGAAGKGVTKLVGCGHLFCRKE